MIKRALYLLSFVLFLSSSYSAEAQGSQYNSPAGGVSSSQVAATVSYGFSATTFVITNEGTNEVFLSFNGSTATTTGTTTNYELKAGRTLAVTIDRNANGWVGFSHICSSGETTTLTVLALRSM